MQVVWLLHAGATPAFHPLHERAPARSTPAEKKIRVGSGGEQLVDTPAARRSSSAVVSFSSPPKTRGHSANARLVVMSTLRRP